MIKKCTRCEKELEGVINICKHCEEELKPSELSKVWNKVLIFFGRIIQVILVVAFVVGFFIWLFDDSNKSRNSYDDLTSEQQESLYEYYDDMPTNRWE